MHRPRDGGAEKPTMAGTIARAVAPATSPALPQRGRALARAAFPGQSVLLSMQSMKAMLTCAIRIGKGEKAAISVGTLRVLE